MHTAHHTDTRRPTLHLNGHKDLERRLTSLTEQIVRDRAATATDPVFAEQQLIWQDLDQAYHQVRTALGRVRGEIRQEA